eukprot:scaffold128380_cov38-Tisochrysis_lutea.AAC.5
MAEGSPPSPGEAVRFLASPYEVVTAAEPVYIHRESSFQATSSKVSRYTLPKVCTTSFIVLLDGANSYFVFSIPPCVDTLQSCRRLPLGGPGPMVAVALVHGEMAERDGGQQMAIEHNNKASDAWTDAGPVEAQIRELEHQIEHLVRSNVEMKEFLEQAPDAELRTAIGENIVREFTRRAEYVHSNEQAFSPTGPALPYGVIGDHSTTTSHHRRLAQNVAARPHGYGKHSC